MKTSQMIRDEIVVLEAILHTTLEAEEAERKLEEKYKASNLCCQCLHEPDMGPPKLAVALVEKEIKVCQEHRVWFERSGYEAEMYEEEE